MSNTIESKIVELDSPRNIIIRSEILELSKLKSNEMAGRTLYSAISPGTEIAAYIGDPPLRPMKVYPRVVGYCNVAEVIAIGDNVKQYKVGDKILNFQSHRTSFICTEESIGALIPEGADLAEAATTYLFHLGYNALLKGDFKPGMSVAVVGLGTVGLTSTALASSFGGVTYAFSNQMNSLKIARELGAESVFRKSDSGLKEKIYDLTDGGIDLVISTSGSWEDWRLAVSIARKEGTVCVIGFPGRTQPIADFNPLDSQYFYDSQLRIISCGHTSTLDVATHEIRFNIKRNCAFLLKEIIQNKIPATSIISSVVPWNELQSVYEAMASRTPGLVTSVLKWD
ncbi:MAG: zinc-binding alcohol dehydrogenase [Candidatus Heimdallarchaeota archaeon]|nr:zinc-binding alcohol dehydrogenase [Candidatus Heimdallarchaeota archaeon]